jgi:hypothetical protein
MATGYGVDSWATDSVFTGRLARGKTLVAQACYRRLTTQRGTLRGGPDEQNYGIDISSVIGAGNPERVAVMLPSMIRGELLKDDRVADVETSVEYTQDTAGRATFTIVVDVQTYEAGNDFELTISVDGVTAKLVGLE